jgi:hypothetical protein
MEIILDHVVSQVHAKLEQWKQLMDYYNEFTRLTNLGDRVIEAIKWRVSCEFTKFQAANAHLGHDSLYLQVAILRI